MQQAMQLTQRERQQLLDQLALRQGIGTKASTDRDLDMWSEAAYSALEAVLKGGGGPDSGPLLLKRAVASSRSWDSVSDFMQSSGLADLPVAQRKCAYALLAELVVERAIEISDFTDAPLTPKFLANVAQQIAGIFDRAFPGYAAAGLAPMVASRPRQRS